MSKSSWPPGARSKSTATAMFSLKKPITRRPIRWLTKKNSGFGQRTNTVKLYSDLKLVAAHPRLYKPGTYSTVDEHIAAPSHCLENSRTPSGVCNKRKPSARPAMMSSENSSEIQFWIIFRAAQGIIGLAKKYGPIRLENACLRANAF